VGVTTMTAYRWVSAFGAELLPLAALFGVVKSSGVVGVDEKWVLVPKNSKAAGENRRWMYVYLAVDCYTDDLLHIAIYERNTQQSAQAFLLALRAKGYQPRVVVTDLRQDYGRRWRRCFRRHSIMSVSSTPVRRCTSSCGISMAGCATAQMRRWWRCARRSTRSWRRRPSARRNGAMMR